MSINFVIILIIALLVVVSFASIELRERRLKKWRKTYFEPVRGTEAAPQHHNLQASNEMWGEALNDALQQFEHLKEDAPKGDYPSTAHDFRQFSGEARAVQVMTYLNKQRGKVITVYTDEDSFHGSIVTLTANQVLLRNEPSGQVKGIKLSEIERIR